VGYGTDRAIASCSTGNIVSSKVIDNWVESYLTAALEVDGKKCLGGLSLLVTLWPTVAGLERQPDHHTERHEIESALVALTGLEEEASIWPTATTQLRQIRKPRAQNRALGRGCFSVRFLTLVGTRGSSVHEC
jgi:hypothetical protein